MRLVVLSALLGFAALGCGKKAPDPVPAPPSGDPPAAPQTDEQKVQGVWKIVGGEMPPGEDAPPPGFYAGIRFTVDGTKVTFTHGGRRPEYFALKGDPTATIKTVDFTVADEKGLPIPSRFGANGDEPERILGIYKFEGDELVLALAVDTSDRNFRPKEFKGERLNSNAKGGLSYSVAVLRLKKADPSEKPPEPEYRPTPSTRKTPTTRMTPSTRKTPSTRMTPSTKKS